MIPSFRPSPIGAPDSADDSHGIGPAGHRIVGPPPPDVDHPGLDELQFAEEEFGLGPGAQVVAARAGDRTTVPIEGGEPRRCLGAGDQASTTTVFIFRPLLGQVRLHVFDNRSSATWGRGGDRVTKAIRPVILHVMMCISKYECTCICTKLYACAHIF